jgi:predicted O-linked N-acetylglucosamine transferase (SPINDLY family)
MAGALLTAARLPELITYSFGDYEERAVQLATQPELLAGLKARLAAEKENGVLFDMPRFVRNLEQGFGEVLARLPHGA